jgi:hypothetical protein
MVGEPDVVTSHVFDFEHCVRALAGMIGNLNNRLFLGDNNISNLSELVSWEAMIIVGDV